MKQVGENPDLGAGHREYYVRDPQGNVMAIYRYDPLEGSLKVVERPLYGSSRLGMDTYEVEMAGSPPYEPLANPAGKVRYELADHLGSVHAVVTDELLAADGDEDDVPDHFRPHVVSWQDYEPFGAILPHRSSPHDVADLPAPRGTLVITEFSNGPSGSCEYVELLVTRCELYEEAETVDIRGWILDDNAGNFNTSGLCEAGVSISAGHLRFANRPQWAAVPVGTVIVLYNAADNCYVFTANETGAGGQFFIPVGTSMLMEEASERPTAATGGSCDYCDDVYTAPATWDPIALNNTRDGIQVRCPGCSDDEPVMFHGLVYGTGFSGIQVGANDMGAPYSNASGNQTWILSGTGCTSPSTIGDWTVVSAPSAGTPPATAGVVASDLLTCTIPCCEGFEELPDPGELYASYRFGFNGMEKDDEVHGSTGTSYTTEFRQYDPRIGRWLSIDPLSSEFPWQSPYVAFDNNPLLFTDRSGASADSAITENFAESRYSSTTGNVTVTGVKQITTKLYSDGENKQWLGTVVETRTTEITINSAGDIVSSVTNTKFHGFIPGEVWNMSDRNTSSNDIEDALPGVRGMANFESNFIKERGMSTHQYTADFAKRRNHQNNREFLAAAPLRFINVLTGTLTTGLIEVFGASFDAATSPNAAFGVSDENPENYVRRRDFSRKL